MSLSLSSSRNADRPAPPTPPPAASRYANWCDAERMIGGPFAGPPLDPQQLAAAAAWAREQASCGIHLSVLNDATAHPRALAIAGAPEACPDFIVYPVANGCQTDEPFDSAWSPSLLDALCLIRPVSRQFRRTVAAYAGM